MKHIVGDRIKYIKKETNNLDEAQVTEIVEYDYIECENLWVFYDRILSLKPNPAMKWEYLKGY
jgi:hypothetical protein